MSSIISELIIVDFGIIECQYSLIMKNVGNVANEEIIFSTDTFKEYPIDIDYFLSDFEDMLRVFITIRVNAEKKFDGYSIVVEAAGLFKFKDGLHKTTQDSLVPSAISITINNVRGFITNLTGACPYSRYLLPAVDLASVMSQQEQKKVDVIPKEKKVRKKAIPKENNT